MPGWDPDVTPPRSLDWKRGDPISPGKYGHRRPQGPCSPGWEEIDIKRLAAGARVGYRNLLLVLTGQRNCTLGFLLHVARALGIPPGDLVTRIEHAYHRSQDGQ